MQYIALLDYHHLDHTFFMKSFAEAMAMQKGCNAIIVHGDSPYTERLLQTGVMRNEAILRSTRDLNHRIIALLADNGISGIGINGFQKEIVRKSGDKLTIKKKWFYDRPVSTCLVLSNLVWNAENQHIEPVPLSTLSEALRIHLGHDYLIVFPKLNEQDPIIQPELHNGDYSNKSTTFSMEDVPDDLTPVPGKCYFSTIATFGKLPDISYLQKISS